MQRQLIGSEKGQRLFLNLWVPLPMGACFPGIITLCYSKETTGVFTEQEFEFKHNSFLIHCKLTFSIFEQSLRRERKTSTEDKLNFFEFLIKFVCLQLLSVKDIATFVSSDNSGQAKHFCLVGQINYCLVAR